MKKILGFAIIGVFALNIGTALAGIESGAMDGGWWVRGLNTSTIVSQYKHYTKQAQASTVSDGLWRQGPWAPSYQVSDGSQQRSLWNNHAYYNNR